MLTSRFTPGPEHPRGAVLVSVTDYTSDRAKDLPGIVKAGMRLRRSWSEMEGAVGVWLWTDPLRRRTGSVSVWTGEDALRGFVRWAPHVEIMRRYARRGTTWSTSWWVDDFQAARVWAAARELLDTDPATR